MNEKVLRRFAVLFPVFAFLLAWCTVASVAQAPAKLVVRNAYIFSMAADRKTPFRGYLVVGEDGRIVTVAAGEPPASLKAATLWDAQGRWVMPGFISAHSHLWQSAYRGLASDQTLLGWIDALYGNAVKQASAEELVGAVRAVAAGRSTLDADAATRVMRRLREGSATDQSVASLSAQEKRVLDLIGDGLTNRQIAERMFLSEKTAKNYVSAVLGKLGLQRRSQAAALAARLATPGQLIPAMAYISR